VFDKIENCPKPVVAAVNGFALGGGCELSMACHFRVAASNAKFGQPEVNLGLIPGYGGTQRLTQLVGKGKAMELMMTADMVGADEAKALGLVNHVFPLEELLQKTKDILQKIQGKAPVAVAKVIACVNDAAKGDADGFDKEIERFGACFATEDMKEGTNAFLEKENLCLKENNLYLHPQIFFSMHARFTRNLLMLCFGMALAHTSSAQNAARIYVEPDGWSIGTTLGESDMWGNVGTKSVLEHYINSKYFNRMGFMGGMFGRYTVHPCFAIRLGVNYGQLYATDKWNYDLAKNSANQGTDAYQRYARNQDALDDVFEGEILFELTPKRFNPESRGASRKGQPYIAAGFTYFHFEPFSTAANTTTWVKNIRS